jgi:hypothetical protein
MAEQRKQHSTKPPRSATEKGALGCLCVIAGAFALLSALSTTCAISERNTGPREIGIYTAAVQVAVGCGAIAVLIGLAIYPVARSAPLSAQSRKRRWWLWGVIIWVTMVIAAIVGLYVTP